LYKGIFREISFLQGFWWRNCHFSGILVEKLAFEWGFGVKLSIVQRYYWRNFLFTGILVEKLPFYRGFGGEIVI